MLGMLLHDIGKGKGHGHVAKGIPLIEALAARMGLPAEDADKVIFLVAHHLTMSHIAQRRDIDDPKTIADPRGGLQDSRAPAHALPAHLRRHARGGARRHDRLAGPDPLGSLRPDARAAHRRAAGAAHPRERGPAGHRGHARRRGAHRGGRAPGPALRPLPDHHLAPAHRRAPAAARPARRRRGGRHRALPPSRSGLFGAGGRHPGRARSLLAHRGHAGLPGHQHPLRPDPHARRRHRASTLSR